MIYALLPPPWLRDKIDARPLQLDTSFEKALDYNAQGYNVYYYPNGVSEASWENCKSRFIQAGDIDKFDWVFVDLDMKHGAYESKEQFIETVMMTECPPTRLVDTGGGIHAYWKVSDLDAMSFLRLSRRLCRKFNSDPAVCMIKQLMRVNDTINTKNPDNYRLCEEIDFNDNVYTCEQLDNWLPPISVSDEAYCKQHYDRAYNPASFETTVDDTLPRKFKTLLTESKEVKELFAGDVKNRSEGDWRLGHILFANGFTRDEAMSSLVNCRKALERAPMHRIGYAENIVNKIWPSEEEEAAETQPLSQSVSDILKKTGGIKGTKFPCWRVFDGTEHGFHLTEVLGLVGGSGSGKTTLALNYFYHFCRLNPNYTHMFISLEQPVDEIAARWVKMTKGKESLHDKVHVLGNYNPDGSYRNLSLHEIQDYILEFEKKNNCKIGACVLDHIGVLKKANKNGETEGLIDICLKLKAFAKATNTFFVVQSQTSREKAGIGDIELDKNAAFGTSMFEWFVDYVVTTWTPLKRIYDQMPNATCSAFKYCKIRHKNVKVDKSREDVVHVLAFDPDTERLSVMTQKQEEAYETWNKIATTLRNKDRKREPSRIAKIDWDNAE